MENKCFQKLGQFAICTRDHHDDGLHQDKLTGLSWFYKDKDLENKKELPYSSLDVLAEDFLETSKSKGFYHESPNYGSDIASLHAEVSELHEAISIGFDEKSDKDQAMIDKFGDSLTAVEEELADCIIKSIALAKRYAQVTKKIRSVSELVRMKNEFNKTRPIFHGKTPKKKPQ